MTRLRALAFLPLVVLSSFALGQQAPPTTPPPTTPPAEPVLTKEKKDAVLVALEDVVTKRAFVPGVDLAKWPEFLAKQREAIDKADKDSDFSRAVNTALRDFGISHIRFLVPRAAQARVRTSTIGVGLNARAEKEGLIVTMVFPKSPAEEAGIKLGDLIMEVDGKLPDSNLVLAGEENTEVALKVKDKDGVVKDLKVARKTYSTVRDDTLTWVGEEAAVIKVHSFSRGYEREKIEKLFADAAKAKFLVLDLRSNGGGATNNLQHLLSLMLPPDTTIGTFVSRRTSEVFAEQNGGKVEVDPIALAKGATTRYKTRKAGVEPFKGKIAVLINRGSASASEICAAALQEHLKAPIVGTKSAGAVLASIFRRLPDGYEIQYPVSDYVTNNWVRLEKNPVVPDIEVTTRAEDGKDPVLDKAIEKLKAG